jgi:hypothetical protein
MQPADLIQIIRLDKKKARQESFSAWAWNDERGLHFLILCKFHGNVGMKGQGQKIFRQNSKPGSK